MICAEVPGRVCYSFVYVIVPEIFPFECRSRAKSIAGIILHVVEALLYLGFLPLFKVHPMGTFIGCSVLCFIGLGIFWKLCPETMNKSSEEILDLMNKT